jgi:hypothetical protein
MCGDVCVQQDEKRRDFLESVSPGFADGIGNKPDSIGIGAVPCKGTIVDGCRSFGAASDYFPIILFGGLGD